ncbi:MAG: MerR family transcriptional regulator [Emergencia timonensis]|uniref:MerR family transcriptional regulator n=1 Tax=Emergencia timonensis TaxID=1776384 RepID=UPI000835EA13|nr:MerR family transcriptional regulator [Emergencia timonensis]WNX87235.1 MerR family transcriptional regulator [Emergencia timonensis]
MRINEVTRETGLSRRAVKYYEEEGLLTVKKDQNGYRNYSIENLKILKEISVYRKLGIGIKEIKVLLQDEDKGILRQVYEEKRKQLGENQRELEALAAYIENENIEVLSQQLEYETIADALRDMIPGAYGYYFMYHFLPYLQIKITTPAQREAYEAIVGFFDGLEIKIPFLLKVVSFLSCKLSKQDAETMTKRMDAQIKRYIDLADEDYAKLREQVRKNVKKKNSLFYRYYPAFASQRKFMKRLQDCGYNDIFIPNMVKLSPSYKVYHDALTQVNDRICADLGLYYDSDYHLVMKR